MEDFLRAITTPYWWISVAAVGILINLISAYLKPPLDRLLSGTVGYWKHRSEKGKAEFEAEVSRLVGNPIDQVFSAVEAVTLLGRSQLHSLKALVWLITAVVLSMVPIPGLGFDQGMLVAVTGTVGTIDIMASWAAGRMAIRLRAICYAARDSGRLDTSKPNGAT